MQSQRLFRYLGLVLATGIVAGSMLRRSVTAVLQTGGTVHFFVHVLLFACLTGLLMKTTRSPGRQWLLCLASVLLGLGTEWYEHLKDGYPIESMDVLADALGSGVVTLGAIVSGLWRPKPH